LITLLILKFITKNKNRGRRSRGRAKRRGSQRNGDPNDGSNQFRNTDGDNPPPFKADLMTMSCRVPRLTDIFVTRQTTGPTNLVATPTSGVNSTTYFQLSNLDNSGAFENVFDQYRIDAIRMTCSPQNNAVGLVTNSTTTLVPLYCVIDYDNTSNLATAAAAREYANCIVLEPGKSFIRVFSPRVAKATYFGAFSSFSNEVAPWIDCASPNVQHYGIKIFVPGATAAQTQLQSWDITYEYFMSFKSVF
jgi:hypothetical protein